MIENRDIARYFSNLGYEKVAIYGYAALGKRLKQQLQTLNCVRVEYIIDRRVACNEVSDVEIVIPSKTMKAVDVIIVTAVHDYMRVKADLCGLGYENVISLEDLIDGISKNG